MNGAFDTAASEATALLDATKAHLASVLAEQISDWDNWYYADTTPANRELWLAVLFGFRDDKGTEILQPVVDKKEYIVSHLDTLATKIHDKPWLYGVGGYGYHDFSELEWLFEEKVMHAWKLLKDATA